MLVAPLPHGLDVPEGYTERETRLASQLRTAVGASAVGPIAWGALLRWVAEAELAGDDERGLLDLVRRELGVPPTLRPVVALHNEGDVTDPHFAVEMQLRHPRAGHLSFVPERGPWVVDSLGRTYLLSAAVWSLHERLQDPVPRDREERLLWWAEVRRVAERADASMSPYLEGEDAVLLDKVRPVFEPDGDDVVVRFEGEGVTADEMDRVIDVAGPAIGSRRSHTSRRPDGTRRRVVVTSTAQKALASGTKKRRYTGREAVEILENPEAHFDEGLFDLSAYSDRVIAIGPPRYRASVGLARVSEEDRDWSEGLDEHLVLRLTDDARPDSPPVTVDLLDEQAVSRAHQAVRDAVDEGRAFAEIEGHMVRSDPELAMALHHWQPAAKPDDIQERPEEQKDLVLVIKENLEELEHGVSPDGLPLVPPDWQVRSPRMLAPWVELRPHQVEGFAKLSWWEAQRSRPIGGGLVADDMGLGKTLQVLTLMAKLAEENQLRPSLVVAPTALLDNWANEARKFIPDAIGRIAFLRDMRRGAEAMLADADLVLTSYEMLARRDLEMGRIAWKLVVCDEAQKIKNPSTRMAHAAKAMKAQLRIAITGTPVENSLEELWSIVDFFQPGMLGARSDFSARYQAKDVLQDDARREEAAAELVKRIEPVILRRMKEDVAKDLPALHRHVTRLGMSDMQRVLYQRVQRGFLADDAGGKGQALATIQRLLGVSSHPLMVAKTKRDVVDPVRACPKLEYTLGILKEVQKRGEKAIIFARWTFLQDLLADVLFEQFGLRVHVLNGSVPSALRQTLVDQFSQGDGFDVMVLSARACGVGLNITAANHVIHYTREWNPAIEAQATDRCYRIGQTRDVHVYLPIVTDEAFTTVEETLDQLLASKESLRRDFVRPSGALAIGLDDFKRSMDTSAALPDETLEDALDLADVVKVATAYAEVAVGAVMEARLNAHGVVLECDGGVWVGMAPSQDDVAPLRDALPAGRHHVACLERNRGLGGWVRRLRREDTVGRDAVLAVLESTGVEAASLM